MGALHCICLPNLNTITLSPYSFSTTLLNEKNKRKLYSTILSPTCGIRKQSEKQYSTLDGGLCVFFCLFQVFLFLIQKNPFYVYSIFFYYIQCVESRFFFSIFMTLIHFVYIHLFVHATQELLLVLEQVWLGIQHL